MDAHIPYSIIVSDAKEAQLLSRRLQKSEANCSAYGRDIAAPARLPHSSIDIINLYNLLPHELKEMCTPDDTSILLYKYGKFKYQSLKKLLAAQRLSFTRALWLDSEAQIIQPVNWRQFFDHYFRNPTIWRSRMLGDSAYKFSHDIMHASAAILGLSLDYFGNKYWNLESFKWIIEKQIVNDLILSVEELHHQSFWQIFLQQPGEPFEICLYYLFVHLRKMETREPMYNKYIFLETERELRDFGLRKKVFFSEKCIQQILQKDS